MVLIEISGSDLGFVPRSRPLDLRPLAGSPGALRHRHEQLHGEHLDDASYWTGHQGNNAVVN